MANACMLYSGCTENPLPLGSTSCLALFASLIVSLHLIKKGKIGKKEIAGKAISEKPL